jgi:hypothetical protein
MATSAAVILADHSQTTLGGSNWAMWHAMIALAGSAAVGSSSGKPYTELAAHFDTVLGPEHPMAKSYRGDFAAELNAEATSR